MKDIKNAKSAEYLWVPSDVVEDVGVVVDSLHKQYNGKVFYEYLELEMYRRFRCNPIIKMGEDKISNIFKRVPNYDCVEAYPIVDGKVLPKVQFLNPAKFN